MLELKNLPKILSIINLVSILKLAQKGKELNRKNNDVKRDDIGITSGAETILICTSIIDDAEYASNRRKQPTGVLPDANRVSNQYGTS